MRGDLQIGKKKADNSPWRMRSKRIAYSIPLGVLIFLILFKNQLIGIHELFSLLVIAMQWITIVVVLFYLLGAVIKRSTFTLVIATVTLGIFLLKYSNTLLSVNFEQGDNNRALTVMTWNLQRVGALTRPQDNTKNIKKVIQMIKDNEVSVAIFQEISLNQTKSIVKQLKLNNNDFVWTDYYGNKRPSRGGIAIIAVDNKNIKLASKSAPSLPPNWQCAYVDIVTKDKTHINILGVHIAPLNVSENQVKSMAKNIFENPQKSMSALRNNARRYRLQFKKQAQQTDRITTILSDFKDATIIAGDFNATSEFPLHDKLSSHLTDAWMVSGNGWGSTRNWLGFIPMRIDYIYVTEQLKATQTKTYSSQFSDHKPIISTVTY